jgi:hypothetical protein
MNAKIIFAYVFLLMTGFQSILGQRIGSVSTDDLNSYEPYLTGELFAPGLIVDETDYFSSGWLSGNISLSNGAIIKDKLIKYNGLLDELFWLEPNSKNVIKLDKEAIQQFHFQNLNGDTSVYFRKIKEKRNAIADSGDVFEQVIYEGSLSLFIIHNYKFERTEFIRINGVTCEKNVYVEEPIYIFRLTNNKTFVMKRLRPHSLYTFSPDNKDKIKEFLKENKSGAAIDNFYLRKLTQFLSMIIN